MLKCEKLNPLPLGLGTRQGFPPSPLLHHTREPTQDNKARKRNKRIQTRREEIIYFLFADNMTIYTEKNLELKLR